MTYPYGEDPLDGLDATPSERLEFLRALDEVDAEEADPAPGGPYGPWDDFHAATAQMDAARAADAARLAEDVTDQLDRRPSDEDKLARAFQRIEAGTYTEAAAFRPARDAYGQFAAACGEVTEFGTCGSRYHDPQCGAVVAGTAAVESAESAEAWAATLRSHPPDPGTLGYAAELAEPSGPFDSFSDLLQAPGGADPGLHARMLAVLADAEAAEPGPEPFPREQLPPVGDLRAALGI
jgi:hypothetical protein